MKFSCRCGATAAGRSGAGAPRIFRESIVLVYLNGEYVPLEEACVSVEDRGFLFADGVYEVIRVYAGQPYELDEHLERMTRGIAALEIEYHDIAEIERVARQLLEMNAVSGAGAIYVQVTRGAAPRKHAFPPQGTAPTVYVAAKPYTPHPAAVWEDGVDAITAPDNRWARCDIKSISLLPNILANQAAKAAGTFEAILIRDGVITEGSHSNVWGVRGGRLITHPASNYILAGMTRAAVFRLARELDLDAVEGVIPASEIHDMDEIFLTGTTTEIMPVVRLDGREIVDGEPGPVTRRLMDAFNAALPR
jgi:D-alanine transaminase